MATAPRKGSLVVVGSGIKALHQLTREARSHLESADKVVYAASEPFTEQWIRKIAPDAEDLATAYADGKDRRISYQEMIDRILGHVRAGLHVCASFYGHPGVYVYPSHESIKQARAEGYRAVMLPGISAEDCLYADLGVDPATCGMLSYEATEFLVSRHRLDPTCGVILWQVDCVGDVAYHAGHYDGRHIPRLEEVLLRHYPANHTAYLYRAPMFGAGRAQIVPCTLGSLAAVVAERQAGGTLYIPPLGPAPVDLEMARRLGMEPADVTRPWQPAEHSHAA